MIASATRQKIKGYLEGFIQGLVSDKRQEEFAPRELRPMRDESSGGRLKPFHESLLPHGLMSISEFERSFSTRLGKTFEECAKLIALDKHKHVAREYRVTGQVSNQAIERIEAIRNEIDTQGMESTYPEHIEKIMDISGEGECTERTCIADLYIKTHDSREFFFEIKSPKPNKGQCLEAIGRQLQIHAITHNRFPKTEVLFACAYNPYGKDKSAYKHSFALKYMDIENQIVLGNEFWEIIGGAGTYEQILEIYQEVGREKGPDMFDQLALNY